MAKTQQADPQLPLMPVSDHHRENGRRILGFINRAMKENGISRSRLADETGYDGAQVTRVLDGEGNIPGGLIAAVIELDRARVLIDGFCALVGCEAVERKPDPAAENKLLRSELRAMREHLDALLEATP
jgi:hypothetical protein